MIEILQSGPANTVQDGGRHGLLHLGISRSGAMDTLAFNLVNALLGNDPGAAVIEVAMFPFRLRFETDGQLALTGADCAARLDDQRLPPHWAVPVRAGALLALQPPERGLRAYLACAGGLQVPMILGSRSTDLKSRFGGLEGRGLTRGDRLATGLVVPLRLPAAGLGLVLEGEAAAFWAGFPRTVSIRVLPAAEHGLFTDAARTAFYGTDWRITNQANRMGYHLSGPELALSQRVELLSHGILPGTVQVPPQGQPIIQLADANTCGGYPKIGVVIGADLWKLAQLGPGDAIRFVKVGQAAALAAERDLANMIIRVRHQRISAIAAP